MKTAWSVGAGLALIAAGVIAIEAPRVGALYSLWLFGWLMFAVGALELGFAWSSRDDAGAIWRFLTATLYLGVGAFLLFHPLDGIAALALSLGGLFLSRSAFLILLSHDVKATSSGSWGWMWFLFDAAVSGAVGFMVLSGFPNDSIRYLGLYTGIGMIVAGVLRARPESVQLRRQHSSFSA
jgi:uncharacterized membrane protein HdeD (DUF308 family)